MTAGRVLGWLAFLGIGAILYFGVIDIGQDDVKQNDRDTVTEDPDCLGYRLVRRLDEDGVISEYRAIHPVGNWDCEYILEDGTLDFRSRTENGHQHVAFAIRDTTSAANVLYDHVSGAMESYGFDLED